MGELAFRAFHHSQVTVDKSSIIMRVVCELAVDGLDGIDRMQIQASHYLPHNKAAWGLQHLITTTN